MILLIATALAGERVVPDAELAQHASSSDCWVAIEGGVYDLTNFLPTHPGGAILASFCGADATAPFRARPGRGDEHSLAARLQLSTMRIGRSSQTPAESVPWRTLDPMQARRGVSAPSAAVIGHKQLHFEIGHYFGFGSGPEQNTRFELGFGLSNVADLSISRTSWTGDSSLNLRVALLQQRGRRALRSLHRGPAQPLTLVAQISGGMRTADLLKGPVIVGQITAERAFGPVRLSLTPAIRWSGAVEFLGSALLDIQPHRTGGFFLEATVSALSGTPDLRFGGGIRIYTRAHVFTIYGANTPALVSGESSIPTGGAGFGFAFSRRFPIKIAPTKDST